VLVCPGGGYVCRVKWESGVIAKKFNELGFQAFVVHYRVYPNIYPAPFLDAARALRIIRRRAQEWNVDPDHIALCGFSAGGNLAAGIGVHHARYAPEKKEPIDDISARPDALILSYAVTSAALHKGMPTLLGEDAAPELIDLMCLDKHVTKYTPPAFMWQTSDDPVVPVENSLLFARALRNKKVPYEMHIYPSGPHGMGLGQDDEHVGTWPGLCAQWLKGMEWKSCK
jgi:acetyl esterase/lipase